MSLLYEINRVFGDLAAALANKGSMVPKVTPVSLDHRGLKENVVSLALKVLEVILDYRVSQESMAKMAFLDHLGKEDLR